MKRSTFCLAVFLAGLSPLASSAAEAKPSLLIVYFLPSDVENPFPEHVERLDRIFTHVQEFYADEMERLGYGPLTYDLERDDEANLVVHIVRGTQTTNEYDRGSRDVGSRMVEQTKASLADEGISVDGRVLVLVAPLLVPDDKETLKEVGPYMGGGNHVGGTAWIFDHPRLDTSFLTSKEPGGFYKRPVSWGRFNTTYIGGTAHELGHAFGLPHVKQAGDEAARGTALMGSGNFTYGEQLRGEGKGSFLTKTSANILAGCRAFVGPLDGSNDGASASLESMVSTFADGELNVVGKFKAPHDLVGISVYHDCAEPAGDYDALGYYSDVDEEGHFGFVASELKPGDWQLRMLCRHRSGDVSRLKFDYSVDDTGTPDLKPLQR